jgi:Type II secretion system (T2SS), protein E, N-terminal domain
MSSPEPGTPYPPTHAAVDLQPLRTAEPLPPLEPIQPLVAAAPPEPVQLQPLERPVEGAPLQPLMPPPLAAPAPTPAEPALPPAAPDPGPEQAATLGVPLGTLIFRAGLLTEEQLEEALEEGVRSGKRLGEVLVERGLLDERELGRLLAGQKGLTFVELATVAPDPAALALLTAERARMYVALPVGLQDGTPLIAVADPSNELVTENLRRALGSEPRLVVASRSDLVAAIDRLYGAVAVEPAPVTVEPEPVAPAQPQDEAPPWPAVARPVAPEPEPEPEPEPVAEVAPVEVAPLAVEPEPVQPVEETPSPFAPEPEPSFARVEAPAEPEIEQESTAALAYEVSLRITDGERVPVGSFDDPQKAREYAREVVLHLSAESESWPFFSGRFLRPDTIVSVDIAPVGEPDRWLGSSIRANWASKLNR